MKEAASRLRATVIRPEPCNQSSIKTTKPDISRRKSSLIVLCFLASFNAALAACSDDEAECPVESSPGKGQDYAPAGTIRFIARVAGPEDPCANRCGDEFQYYSVVIVDEILVDCQKHHNKYSIVQGSRVPIAYNRPAKLAVGQQTTVDCTVGGLACHDGCGIDAALAQDTTCWAWEFGCAVRCYDAHIQQP